MDKNNYYAIIPANVRYDKNLPPNAKLLYGEITALTNQEGYCWASNSYFSALYEVNKETISRWISSLEEKGYVKTQLIYKDNSKQIEQRRIYLGHIPIDENDNTYPQNNHGVIDEKDNPPIAQKVKENTTEFNNTLDSIYSLFNHWKNQNIINHRELTQNMKSHINARLKSYSVDELKQAITNYAEILESDNYYWTHKWTLQDFMKPDNVVRFLDESNPKENFKSNKSIDDMKASIIDWGSL